MGLDREIPVPGPGKVTKSIGQTNLMPEKYRRQVVDNVTRLPVGADYEFPTELTGDQNLIRFYQETTTKARLEIYEQIIAVDADPLQSQDVDDWGTLRITETVVIEGTPRDSGFLVKTSKVTAFGDGKAIKITVLYPDDLADREHHGQTRIAKYGVVVPYVDTIIPINTEIGLDSNAEIEVLDSERSRKRVIDRTALLAAVADIVLVGTDTVNVYIPDELISLTAYHNKDHGSGIGYDSSTANGSGGTFFAKAESSSSAKGEASIMPMLVPEIRSRSGRDKTITRYSFFIEEDTDPAALLAAIIGRTEDILGTTVSSLPNFNPQPHTFVLFGGRRSVNGRSNHSESKSGNTDGGSSEGHGSGASIDQSVGTPVGEKVLSETIHGALDVINAVDTEAADSGSSSVMVTGRVQPDSIPATSPDSIPDTGMVLIRQRSDLFEKPVLMVDVEVLDWSTAFA